MSILITSLKVISALIVVLVTSGLTYQYVVTRLDARKYQPIGTMVDIGGYKLHMIDSGVGNPVVVMDAGGGCNSLDWSLVQPEIAKFTRVITYDRAGYPWSDESSLERTSENMVKELHRMLHNAGVPAPYILVGHSQGGLNVQLFANMYPDEVLGVVLVDSTHEDALTKLPNTLPSTFAKFLITASYYLGLVRLKPTLAIYPAINMNKYSLDIQKAFCSQRVSAKFIKAGLQELSFLQQDCNQLKSAGGMLDGKPLTVISAGKLWTVADTKGQASQEQINHLNSIRSEFQSDLVKKSSCGKQIIAEKSGHMINYDQPEIIVEAVRDMVDELNK